jgi:F-type H+-transporting ATPase subunit b
MDLIIPDLGLVFWMTLSFLILLFILKKYAWKPVMKALKEREDRIAGALKEAEKAREEMLQLTFSNEQLLKEAKEERDMILREARKIRESMLAEAQEKAQTEANRILENARENLHYEKMAALTELKNQIAILSIEIAEKMLGDELDMDGRRKQLMEKLLKEISFN